MANCWLQEAGQVLLSYGMSQLALPSVLSEVNFIVPVCCDYLIFMARTQRSSWRRCMASTSDLIPECRLSQFSQWGWRYVCQCLVT